jgi:hypothetical protein
MKNIFRRIFLLATLTLLPLFMAFAYGDPPGPPGSGGAPGSGGIPLVGPVGDPIGDSIAILIALSVVFGVFKLYEFWRIEKVQRELY